MTSHPVVAQRNRGTLPGRDRWRMAPWEVLSINNPRRMPGQGSGFHCLFVSLLFWPAQPQMLHFALISIFFYLQFPIQVWSSKLLKCKTWGLCVLWKGFICCRAALDAIRLLNAIAECKFGGLWVGRLIQVLKHCEWNKCNPQYYCRICLIPLPGGLVEL